MKIFSIKQSRFWLTLVGYSFAVSVVILPASQAFAGSGGGHEATIASLIPFWVNFSLYIAILFLLLRNPVSQGWKSRSLAIEQLAKKGERELEDANRRLKEASLRLSAAQNDAASLKSQLQSETENEVNEILRDARQRAERVVAQGKDIAAAERKTLEATIKREMVEAVMKRAEEIVKSDLTSDKDASLRLASASKIAEILH